ncbi:SRPBCC family protein [Micromonospora chalcea]|uniref:SRPBCC family protein n=1 Tax=Micromonospora chalcea TaxID=1874 RepID=UPI000CE4B92C|nr:cyclase [Micromonospora chalcea]PPA56640.1 hypothetical protein BAW75_26850 [Micromonospora chalcea]
MPHIELTTVVQAVPETVFDVCLDVDKHTESMGSSAERAVGGIATGRLKAGDAVTLEARHFGRWHHEDSFRPNPADSSATLMRDVIDFTAPMGPVGGLVASVILRPYLQRLIARRNSYLARDDHGRG